MDEQILTEALQKAVAIVDAIEERYREVALPIILQSIINSTDGVNTNAASVQSSSDKEVLELQLPANMSANEFFRKVKPESHPGRFVCAAYYLLHTGKAEHFTQADILEIYGKLREPKPKNPSDVVNQCIRKVHIIDGPTTTDKQKSWVITPDGERYVEGLLNDNANGGNSSSR